MCGGQLLILGVFVILSPLYFQDRVSQWAWIYLLFQLTGWPTDPRIYLSLNIRELGFRCVSPLSAFVQALEIWILVLVLEHQVLYLLDHLPEPREILTNHFALRASNWKQLRARGNNRNSVSPKWCALLYRFWHLPHWSPLLLELPHHLCIMSGTFQPRQLLYFVSVCLHHQDKMYYFRTPFGD